MSNERRTFELEEKNKMVQYLLEQSKGDKPKRGLFAEVVVLFGVHRHTIANLWATASKQRDEGKPILIVSVKLGIPIKKRQVFSLEKLKEISFRDRTTIRDLACDMGVSITTVANWVKWGLIRPHSNAIKPLLNEANKFNMIEYCLSMLKYNREANIIKFESMHNVIHIYEKWFFLTNANMRTLKCPLEKDPYRFCKSKRFIANVMFLCAMGRPLYGVNGEVLFDGKIGIFPFTTQIPAARNSKNRTKGNMETKNIDSITKQVTKELTISKVIPAIKVKWPLKALKDIIIQQDNAKPHIANDDADFRKVASSDGFNIQLLCQPANSPDTNINDLGWFRSIQSLQHKKKTYTVDDLVKNVEDAYEELTHVTLNKVFLSLQQCCIEIMKVKGHNDYTLPHMGKDALIRHDTLPENLEVDEDLVKEMIDYLMEHVSEFKNVFDFQQLMINLGL